MLVCAYAFSPVLGSEFAQGWNYVLRMSRHFHVTVLVGSSDGRMGDVEALRRPEVSRLADVEIHVVPMDGFCRLVRFLDVTLGMSWLFVLGLRRWHRLAFARAESLNRDRKFDVAHQLGPVGFRNPGFLYQLDIPTYWGPVGGLQFVDLRLAWHSSPRYFIIALLRNCSTFIASRAPALRRAVRGFGRISFATRTNRDYFASLFGVDGPVLSDQAIENRGNELSLDSKASREGPGFTVVWCGSVDGRKNIYLLVDIATELRRRGSAAHLRVIGDGPLLAQARRECRSRGLDNVQFEGRIAREQVREAMVAAQLVCFTSLSEANTSTLFEALEALCVPLALDLDGFSSNISPDYGVLVSPRQPISQIVSDYADAISRLEADPGRMAIMRAELARAMPSLNWESLCGRHLDVIEGLLPASPPAAREYARKERA